MCVRLLSSSNKLEIGKGRNKEIRNSSRKIHKVQNKKYNSKIESLISQIQMIASLLEVGKNWAPWCLKEGEDKSMKIFFYTIQIYLIQIKLML